MAAHIEDYSPEQLRALADKKERAASPDVVDVALGRAAAPPSRGGWPTEVLLGEHTFHVVPSLSDDWEFQEMLTEFLTLGEANDLRSNTVAKDLVRLMYREPYEEIMQVLRDMHPEDERPHVHVDDMAALIKGAVPKVREG